MLIDEFAACKSEFRQNPRSHSSPILFYYILFYNYSSIPGAGLVQRVGEDEKVNEGQGVAHRQAASHHQRQRHAVEPHDPVEPVRQPCRRSRHKTASHKTAARAKREGARAVGAKTQTPTLQLLLYRILSCSIDEEKQGGPPEKNRP